MCKGSLWEGLGLLPLAGLLARPPMFGWADAGREGRLSPGPSQPPGLPLQSNALPSHVKISVSRQTLFEDSFQQVRPWPGRPVWGWGGVGGVQEGGL